MDLASLLELQRLDTQLDQLRHRRDSHPLRGEISRVQRERGQVQQRRDDRRAQRDELLRQQRRWDDEVAKVRSRRDEINAALYGGSVTSPKELLALQADNESLQRRQTELEDSELEVMEQVETATAAVDELDRTLADLDERLEELDQQLTAATAELEVEIDRVQAQREGSVASIPPRLLDRYDRMRRDLGGVAIVRLHGSTCEGCHLTLSALTIDHLKKLPPDEVPLCEECGRILVR